MTAQPVAAGAITPVWTLPDRLRKARLHAGYTQATLAAETGISRASIQNYEAGKTEEPSRPNLLAWATACGVPLEWLCHGDLRPCDFRPRGIPAGQPPAPGTRSRSNYMQSSYAAPIALRAA